MAAHHKDLAQACISKGAARALVRDAAETLPQRSARVDNSHAPLDWLGGEAKLVLGGVDEHEWRAWGCDGACVDEAQANYLDHSAGPGPRQQQAVGDQSAGPPPAAPCSLPVRGPHVWV